MVAGSVVGFLISQVFYWRFNKKGLLGTKEFEGIGGILGKKTFDEFEYNGPKDKKLQKYTAEAIFDFAVYLRPEKGLLDYMWRRWDVYAVLSSSHYAFAGAGLITGIVFRLCYGLRTIVETGLDNFANLVQMMIPELLLLLPLAGIVVLFIVALFSARSALLWHYRPMFEAIVTFMLHQKKEDLSQAFPDYFKRRHITLPEEDVI